MRKRLLAGVLAGVMALSLAACGNSGSTAATTAAAAAGGSNTAPGVSADGKDADGNIVDLTAYSVSLGAQWFTDEDNEIWSHIEDKSSNADKILIRVNNTNRSFDESASLRGTKRMLINMKKELGDRIEIQLFNNATLGGTADQKLGGLQAKNFEIDCYNVGAFYEYTKAFTPLDVGFLIPDLDAGIKVCDPDSEPSKIMRQKCLDDTGIYVLQMGAIGMRHITTAKNRIQKLDDLKGLKIRVQNNNLHMAMFDALGTAPTPIAFSELFTALQQHTVDGQENPISNIFEQNYAEVQDFMTLSNHLYTAGATSVNYEWLMGLPEDVRECILEAAKVGQKQSGEDLKNCDGQQLEYLKTQMTVDELDDEEIAKFKELSYEIYPKAAEIMGQDYWDEIRAAIEKCVAE